MTRLPREVDALELHSGRWHSISGRVRSGLTYIWGWVSNMAAYCLTVLLSSALANLLELENSTKMQVF